MKYTILLFRLGVPCLITSSIDEDLYFRMTTRDVSPKLGYVKPAITRSNSYPLCKTARRKDQDAKRSDANSAIFLSPTLPKM